MIISLATLTLTLLGLVSARELSVARKDPKHILIKSKGSNEVLWFSLSIKDGVPIFEVKGGKEDKEDKAKTKIQLAMNNVHERDGGASYNLQGMQNRWDDIRIETQSGAKSPKQITLHSRMVRPEKDIAGNYFTILLTATVDENAHEFSIRPMIQNFPYAYKEGKGLLAFKQLLTFSPGISTKEGASGATFIGSAGNLLMLRESALEDGNPGQLLDAKLVEVKAEQGREQADVVFNRLAEVQFATVRPKNVTFVEKLVLDPKSIKPVHPDSESRAEKDKIKGMSFSAAAPRRPIGLVISTIVVALAVILLQV